VTEVARTETPSATASGWTARPWAPWLVVLARLALAAVLAFAAVPKLGDAAGFARDIDNYHLLPVAWAAYAAVLMPPLELVVALALLVGIHARGAALVSAGMMVVFAGAMAQAIARGIDLDCGCFGSALAMEVSGWSILRNVVLASLSVPIVLGPEVTPAAIFGRRTSAAT
jgi:putative oxidoreductase